MNKNTFDFQPQPSEIGLQGHRQTYKHTFHLTQQLNNVSMKKLMVLILMIIIIIE